MRKILAVTFASLFLIFSAVPMIWLMPSNISAAETDPKTDALNNYLQSHEQKKIAQQQQQTNTASNNEQNSKATWPWWVNLFSAVMVLNAILSFFALIFAIAALWKWLALKR